MSTCGDKAYRFLEKLSFPRTSGTEKELEAARMIMEEIRGYGLEPVLEPFEVKWRKPVMAEFTVTAPEKVSYTVTGLVNAKDTPEGGVDAEFYYMEMIDEFTLKKAAGKFVLLNERASEADYEKLMKAGIVGFMIMSGTVRDTEDNSDLDTFRYRAVYHRFGEVPAFTIRMVDAMDMMLRRPEKVHFELHTQEEVLTSHNVVTVVPGTDLAEESFAVGGHYDSTEFSYGSWDNGAGTVQVMGLLEHLAKNPPRRTVKTVIFGSEEVGLNGSKAYLAAHPEEKEKLLCMINLDVGGSILGKYFAAFTATPATETYIMGLLKEAGVSAGSRVGVMSSDCAVFADNGIPTISLGRTVPQPGGGFMHTRYDNMKMISADVLGEEIRMLNYVADRLANAEYFPIEKKIPDDLKEQIIKYFGTGLSNTWQEKENAKGEKK